MEINQALDALSALAQPMRLDAFRLLVKAGPAGLCAGEIATRLQARPNTLSANLAHLVAAGLVRNTREGRQIRYVVEMEGMQRLLGFLMEDCCGGQPELCRPVLEKIVCC
ncbi:MAG TPA: transcriptional regulator [Rhodobacteraceae bacterium]|jgi:ArsR family transcriptional regulator|nr:transcriptional regulator [Paracoccaceae bacterium]HBV54313.1 transcriptional regulator [Paracoccaceae bacterium]